MFALPGQTPAMAQADVARAIALAPAHVSHYQLTLEPNTLFALRPPAGLPDEDAGSDMQDACQAMLAEAGFEHYETSAHARPGKQCAHNLNYWQFGDYLGIGAGAHGKISLGSRGEVMRRWKHKHPAQYLAHAGTAAAIGGDEILSPARLPFDFMLNALRLHQGFTLAQFEHRTGLSRAHIAAPLAEAEQRGLLHRRGDAIVPTLLGRRFANDAIALFLAD